MNGEWERGRRIADRRLTPDAVQRVIAQLQQHGLELMEADYQGASFGSWYFVVCGRRGCVRVAFDGRDGFLSYDRWNGGPAYEASRGRDLNLWEELEVLNPDVTPAEGWSEAGICDRVRYHLGVGPPDRPAT